MKKKPRLGHRQEEKAVSVKKTKRVLNGTKRLCVVSNSNAFTGKN